MPGRGAEPLRHEDQPFGIEGIDARPSTAADLALIAHIITPCPAASLTFYAIYRVSPAAKPQCPLPPGCRSMTRVWRC